MKFLMGDNDGMPAVVVFADREQLVASFWGFGFEEAERWFNSEGIKESLESWHSMFGDCEMAVKATVFKGEMK
ncbi:hypothetical protein [Sulfuriferula sp.]|uniref:hypothetical protein n=1 Tax=Sulfuriferula sp. TaxID=2025307 RepID=UPI00272F2A3F|nr:hypothetical protein [Sulfuriferula sp.]MDP2025611.1 hypothetical protein [Sulfuriferula sp.]